MKSAFGETKFRQILALGAHPDDIEIGCGGTLMNLLSAPGPETEVIWVVFSGNEVRRLEARNSAEEYLRNVPSRQIYLDFPDSYFPERWGDIKREIQQLAASCDPDLIFSHRVEDRHQDHRVLAELTWNAFRNNLILEYEIPKYEGDLTHNNFYSEIGPDTALRKSKLLMDHFPSQAGKDWFDPDLFQGHLRLRGIESPSDGKFAEAFYCRKCLFG